MSDSVVEKINNLLNEEKWTRATLNNYTVKNFQDLDSLFEEISESESHKEIKEICEEHLEHSKNSIISLYISGIILISYSLFPFLRITENGILLNIYAEEYSISEKIRLH